MVCSSLFFKQICNCNWKTVKENYNKTFCNFWSFKIKGIISLVCWTDMCLADTLNFCLGPITTILICISYREIGKKAKSQSTEAGIHALCIWYCSFFPLNTFLAVYQFTGEKKDFFSEVKLISSKIEWLFPLAA